MRDTTLLGRKRGLLLALGFGCVAAILLLALAYRVYRPSVDQVSSDDEVYKVYSAAIKELLLKRGGAELSTTLVVIKDQTVSYRWEGWNDPTKRTQGWAKSGIAVNDRTLKDFKRKNEDSVLVEPAFRLPAPSSIISDEELQSYFKNGPSWAGFYENHPRAIGYIVLSSVGFNPDHNQAFLYVQVVCGNRCGKGFYVLLDRDGGTWSVQHADVLCVS